MTAENLTIGILEADIINQFLMNLEFFWLHLLSFVSTGRGNYIRLPMEYKENEDNLLLWGTVMSGIHRNCLINYWIYLQNNCSYVPKRRQSLKLKNCINNIINWINTHNRNFFDAYVLLNITNDYVYIF